MRYLFIVQGEGRGHLTQALSLAALLRRAGHEVVQVLVGKNPNRTTPGFFAEKIGCPVVPFSSPSFDYGSAAKRGNTLKTVLGNVTPYRLARWKKSIDIIAAHIEAAQADVIVNFYEILMGLTGLIHRLDVPVVSIGHQFLVDHRDYGHASDAGQMLLRLNNALCSLGTTKTLALSFYPLRDDIHRRIAVVPPLLRGELFTLTPRDEGYLLGYLMNPGYADEVRRWHAEHPERRVHVFWDKHDAPEMLDEDGLTFHRIDDRKFLELMAGCSGFASTAGFESVCEAMWLGKPALLIPAHLEQQINAADAEGVGAGVVAQSFDLSLLDEFIGEYPADTDAFREWVARADELFVRHLTTLV